MGKTRNLESESLFIKVAVSYFSAQAADEDRLYACGWPDNFKLMPAFSNNHRPKHWKREISYASDPLIFQLGFADKWGFNVTLMKVFYC